MLLTECTNSAEVTAIRTLLEAHGIPCLTEGENQSYLAGGFGNPIVVARRVRVQSAELERATELLSSRPDDESGRVCAVHQEPATAACSRCESALCAKCESSGTPQLCESCVAPVQRPSASPAKPTAFFVVLAIVVLLIATRSLWLR